jgi:hypothetical protein
MPPYINKNRESIVSLFFISQGPLNIRADPATNDNSSCYIVPGNLLLQAAIYLLSIRFRSTLHAACNVPLGLNNLCYSTKFW